MSLASAVECLVGPDLPIALRAYDGSSLGPSDSPTTLVIRSPDAIRRILTAPGELGLGRAYVVGDLDVEGISSSAWPRSATGSRSSARRSSPRSRGSSG